MTRTRNETAPVSLRLARLERANRRLRAGLALLAVLVGAAVLGGAMWVQEELRAERFLLRGAGDAGRGEFSLSKDGMPQLVLKDRDGFVRAALGLDATGAPSLAFHDKEARPRARLEVGSTGRPALAFLNATGKRVKEFGPSASSSNQGRKNVRVKFTTSLGDFVVELNAEKAPVTVENFLRYVDDEFYDGTIFHRVIDNFMIQGGGFTPDISAGTKDTRPPIRNEARNGLKNVRGSIAMARTPNPHSATAQFFINVNDNAALDYGICRDGWGYAVFGKVVDGMDTVDKIRKVETGTRGGHQNVPVDTVEIKSVRRLEE